MMGKPRRDTVTAPPTSERFVTVLVISVLVAWVGLALLVQPMSDDFWFAYQGRDRGWWSAWSWYLSTWNARWLANALLFALHVSGDVTWSCRVLVMAVMAGFLVALSEMWAAWGVSSSLRWRGVLLLVASWGWVASWCALPYWTSGAMNYLVSAVMGLLVLGAVARGWRILAAAAGFAVAGGCEILVVPTLVGLLLRYRRDRGAGAWWWGAMGVALGGAVVVLAPCNAQRVAALGGWKPEALGLLPGRCAALISALAPWVLAAVGVLAGCAGTAGVAARLSWRWVRWPVLAMVLVTVAWMPAMLGIGALDRHVESTGVVLALVALAPGLPALAICGAQWLERGWWAQVLWCLVGGGLVAMDASVPAVCWLLAVVARRIGATWLGPMTLALLWIGALLMDGYLPGVQRERVWMQRRAILAEAGHQRDAVVVLPPLPVDGSGHARFLLLTELGSLPHAPWNQDAARWYHVGELWVVPDAHPHAPGAARWWRGVDQACHEAGQERLVWDPRCASSGLNIPVHEEGAAP